jgi:CBS domain containing-hemolysin-like protein
MELPWAEIGLVVLLVVLNAGFAGSEIALISLREGQLRRLEQEGDRGRLVARLARDPNQFLVDGWRLEVLDVRDRAITQVRLVPLRNSARNGSA